MQIDKQFHDVSVYCQGCKWLVAVGQLMKHLLKQSHWMARRGKGCTSSQCLSILDSLLSDNIDPVASCFQSEEKYDPKFANYGCLCNAGAAADRRVILKQAGIATQHLPMQAPFGTWQPPWGSQRPRLVLPSGTHKLE